MFVYDEVWIGLWSGTVRELGEVVAAGSMRRSHGSWVMSIGKHAIHVELSLEMKQHWWMCCWKFSTRSTLKLIYEFSVQSNTLVFFSFNFCWYLQLERESSLLWEQICPTLWCSSRTEPSKLVKINPKFLVAFFPPKNEVKFYLFSVLMKLDICSNLCAAFGCDPIKAECALKVKTSSGEEKQRRMCHKSWRKQRFECH